MSGNIFFISDLHLGHNNMCTFTNWDGTKARNFDNYLEADAKMVENWNKLVTNEDTVYVLGDVCYSCEKKYAESILDQLNGKTWKLIGGNHDLWSTQWYLRYFKYIRGCMNLDNFYLTHTPIHPDSKGRFKLNICGHIHNQQVMNKEYYWNGTEIVYKEVPDPFYFNVSVDYKYRYAPIPYEEVQQYYQDCLDKGLLQPIPPKRY